MTIGKNKDDAATFWMAVPPTTFTKGFTFIIEAVNGETFVKSSDKEQVIKRNICKDMSPVNISSAYEATNVTEVTLDQDVIYFKEAGEKIQLHATVYPEDATNKNVFWTSFDESIATVDQDGTVTAVGEGEVTIEVITEDGEHTAEAKAHIDWKVPVVESFEMSTTEIDVSDSPQTVTFTLHLTDATGVKDIDFHVFNSENTRGEYNHEVEFSLMSGDTKDGVYTGSITFDNTMSPGDYLCVIDHLSDELGNVNLTNLGVKHLNVVNTSGDFECPIVESFEMSTSEIDVTESPKTVTFTLHLTDATGVKDIDFHVFNSENTQGEYNHKVEFSLSSGSSKDGIYTGSITFDNSVAPGDYLCVIDHLSDELGNVNLTNLGVKHLIVANNL